MRRAKAASLDVVVIGNIGHDIYMLPADTIQLRPAGSAYNMGVGLQVSGASGTIVGTVAPSFGKEHFSIFSKRVQFRLNPITKPVDQAFLFDLRMAPDNDIPVIVSTAAPQREPWELLSDTNSRDLLLHVGTLEPARSVALLQELRSRFRPLLFSTNLYHMYIERSPELVAKMLDLVDVAFMNSQEFELLYEHGILPRRSPNKIYVVTDGPRGAYLIVNETPVFHYAAPHPREVVCTVGAGDVFIGAFLGTLAKTRNYSLALLVACEAATLSVTDYGVHAALLLGARLKELGGLSRALGAAPTEMLHASTTGKISAKAPARADAVVEATGVFAIRDGKLLLAEKLPENAFIADLLYVPGGKRHGKESMAQCARREMLEETTLSCRDLALSSIFFYYNERSGRLYRFYQYITDACAGDARAMSDISATHWIPLEEIVPEKLFPYTWAQLQLMRPFVHAITGHPSG